VSKDCVLDSAQYVGYMSLRGTQSTYHDEDDDSVTMILKNIHRL